RRVPFFTKRGSRFVRPTKKLPGDRVVARWPQADDRVLERGAVAQWLGAADWNQDVGFGVVHGGALPGDRILDDDKAASRPRLSVPVARNINQMPGRQPLFIHVLA